MTREDYCSTELSKLLRAKGLGGYETPYAKLFGGNYPLSIPLKWLRETYNVIIMIDYNEDEDCEDNERFGFTIYQKNIRKIDLATYPTYEEAVEAALKYSLENLI